MSLVFKWHLMVVADMKCSWGLLALETAGKEKASPRKNLIPVGLYSCLTSLSSSLLLSQAAVWCWEWAPAEGYILPRLQANWRRGQDTLIKTSNCNTFFFSFLNIQHLTLISLHFSAVIWIQTGPLWDTDRYLTPDTIWTMVFAVVQTVSLLF